MIDINNPPSKQEDLGKAAQRLKAFHDGFGGNRMVDEQSGLTSADLLVAAEALTWLHNVSTSPTIYECADAL